MQFKGDKTSSKLAKVMSTRLNRKVQEYQISTLALFSTISNVKIGMDKGPVQGEQFSNSN